MSARGVAAKSGVAARSGTGRFRLRLFVAMTAVVALVTVIAVYVVQQEMETDLRQNLDRREGGHHHSVESDLLSRLDQYREAEAANFSGGACRAAGLDAAAVHRAKSAAASLSRLLPSLPEPEDAEIRLMKALLFAYPDRVAKGGGKDTYARVGGARLARTLGRNSVRTKSAGSFRRRKLS